MSVRTLIVLGFWRWLVACLLTLLEPSLFRLSDIYNFSTSSYWVVVFIFLMLEATTGNNIIMQVIGIKWLGSKIQ